MLRTPGLSSSFWYDEVFTLKLAQLPLPRMIEALAGDVHPPLWYLIVSVWPGPDRLPALIFGLASLWLAWPLLTRLAPTRVALIGLALMTISPFLIYYAAEARMYSLLLFFIILGTRAALAGNWALLGLSMGLGLLTHNHLALYVPGLIIIFIMEVSFSWLEVSKMGLVASLIYMPWLTIAWRQLQAISGHYWILPLSPGRLVYLLVELIAGYSLTGLGLLVMAGVALALALVGLVRAIQAGAYEVIILAIMPVMIGILLSVAVAPVLIARVLIGVLPFLLLLIAWGGYDLYYHIAGHWLTVTGIAGGIIALYSMFAAPARPDYASAYAALGVQPGDQCYHLSAGSHILASYYLPQCYHITWAGAPRKANGLSDQTIVAMGIERGDFDGHGWIFSTWEPYTPQFERDHLARILGRYKTRRFVILKNEFVTSSAWRIDD